MTQRDHRVEFLERRLDDICAGLIEGVRREVERLERLGVPLCVADNGRVVYRVGDAEYPTDPTAAHSD